MWLWWLLNGWCLVVWLVCWVLLEIYCCVWWWWFVCSGVGCVCVSSSWGLFIMLLCCCLVWLWVWWCLGSDWESVCNMEWWLIFVFVVVWFLIVRFGMDCGCFVMVGYGGCVCVVMWWDVWWMCGVVVWWGMEWGWCGVVLSYWIVEKGFNVGMLGSNRLIVGFVWFGELVCCICGMVGWCDCRWNSWVGSSCFCCCCWWNCVMCCCCVWLCLWVLCVLCWLVVCSVVVKFCW